MGSGYRKIFDFITSYGTVTAVGVEGTGSYGAELARTLRGEGLTVLEVNRPNRAARRLKGKSDPLDAYQAAKSVLEGRTTSIPKAKDGPVECMRILRAGRASALKARTAAINQIKCLLVSAPDKLRGNYRAMATPALLPALQRTRPSGHTTDPEYVTLLTLKALATRCQSLAAEIATADAALKEIIDAYAPMLCDLPGVGTDVASQLHCRRQPGPVAKRSPVRFTRRGRPSTGIIRQDNAPPAQPRRRPQSQPCPLSSGPGPHGVMPKDQGLRGKTHRGGQEQTGNHALPQTLRSPGNLPPDHQPPTSPRQLRPPPNPHRTRMHHHNCSPRTQPMALENFPTGTGPPP